MNINAAFPGKYIKAADLQGRDYELVISRLVVEKVLDSDEPVLYFTKTDKGLVLNKTNAGRIADMHGEETDDWTGLHITLFPTECDFAGKLVPCIRVRTGNPPPVQPVVVPEPVHTAIPDSEIPF